MIFLISGFTTSELEAGEHPWGSEKLSPKEIGSYFDSAVLAAKWYMNNQNTQEHPWGGIHDSADLGRFIYEYYPTRRWARGNGVWGQGVGIMALLALHSRTGRNEYLQSAKMAGEYLKSLQILDSQIPANFGAIREHNPQDNWSFPRDAATGGMAFAALYQYTGNEEYLFRAKILCNWFIEYCMGEEKWPHRQYWFDRKKQPPKTTKEYFQVGAGLMFYYVYKLTGEKRYVNNGLIPICELLTRDYHINPWLKPAPMEMESPWSTNDDFAAITILAAYRVTGDKKYFDAVKRHADWLVSVQDKDGSYSGFSSAVYVTSLTMLELCRVIEDERMNIDTAPYYKAVHKAARFGLTLQERESRDIMAYGGFYGQTYFGLNKDRIHHRVTGYSLIFNLRYEGRINVPYYSTYGWKK
ncbi:hypothetical protein ACFL4Z_03390 [candidate division KSB1 bacterium]